MFYSFILHAEKHINTASDTVILLLLEYSRITNASQMSEFSITNKIFSGQNNSNSLSFPTRHQHHNSYF